MRVVLWALVALSLVLPACSAAPVNKVAATPPDAPAIPAQAPDTLRSTVATAGIRMYLDVSKVASRESEWPVRIILVNERNSPRSFDDMGKDVTITQNGMPDSIGVGDIMMQRSPRPLELAPHESVVATLTFHGMGGLTAGYHPVDALVSLEDSTAPSSIILKTEPLSVLFR